MSQLESLAFKVEAAKQRMISQSLNWFSYMNRAELSHLPPCARPMHLSCLLLTHHHDLAHQTQLVVEML